MHCPNCGKPATSEQQFCRACGMNLESVGNLVARHSASPAAVQLRIDRREREQAAVRMMFNWMTWGFLILGIGVAMIVINKNFDIGNWFATLSSFIALGGMGVAVAGVFKAMRQGTSLPARQTSGELGSREKKSVPTNPIPPALPSVTEQTTQLIGVNEAPTNKMMDTGPRE